MVVVVDASGDDTAEPLPSAPRETYLGDGLYASYDNWMIRLRAPDSAGERVVYLEPQGVDAFLRYVYRLRGQPPE